MDSHYKPFWGDQRVFASLSFWKKNEVKVSENMYGIDHMKQT